MENNGATYSAQIGNYLDLHMLMQVTDRALSTAVDTLWQSYDLAQTHLKIPDGVTKLQFISCRDVDDAFGHLHSIVIGRDPANDGCYYVWNSRPGSSEIDAHAAPVVITRRHDGVLEMPYGTLRIGNDRFLYNHQAKAIADYADALAHHASADAGRTTREVVAFATGTGKSYIVGHALKALGGSGVAIVPKGLGKQAVGELKEVMADRDIISGAAIAGNTEDVKRQLAGFQGIIVIEEQDLSRFMGQSHAPGWLCTEPRKFVSIDEAHEFTIRYNPDQPAPGMHVLQRLAAHNHVMAVTATPNEDLYRALGIEGRGPASSMNMFDAMHRLPNRAFRPLTLERVQVATPHDVHALNANEREAVNAAAEPAMRFAALAGYFGRDEFKGPDYFLSAEDQLWHKRADSAKRFHSASSIRQTLEDTGQLILKPAFVQQGKQQAISVAIIEAMKLNHVRYSQHKHIMFAVRPELVRNLACDLQAICDGNYPQIDALKQQVWQQRAQSAIAEFIREYRREYGGIPHQLSMFLENHDLAILAIRGENLAASTTNQEAYRAAMRRIDPEAFKAVLPAQLYDAFIGTVDGVDITREARDAAHHTARETALRAIAVDALRISPKRARELARSGALRKQLKETGIDPREADAAAPAYYALAIVKEQGQEVVYDGHGQRTDLTAKEVDHLVRSGRVMHVADTHHFVTGFSDPDVMMTTRAIENLGDYTVRATQILGRPIREKDGVAALHELVGPCVNMRGILGVDRHFSCYDVVAPDYFTRSAAYERGYISAGRALWQPPVQQTARAVIADRGQETGHAR